MGVVAKSFYDSRSFRAGVGLQRYFRLGGGTVSFFNFSPFDGSRQSAAGSPLGHDLEFGLRFRPSNSLARIPPLPVQRKKTAIKVIYFTGITVIFIVYPMIYVYNGC